MISRLIGRAIGNKIKQNVRGKRKIKDWENQVLAEFFGLMERPGITDADLINGSEAMMQKWFEYTEWEERRQEYEKFTGRRWK